MNVTLEINNKNEVDMDDLMLLINSLSKVQQAIIHTHLSEKIPMNETVREQLNTDRAHWLYSV